MSIFGAVLRDRKHRLKAREIARESWIKANGEMPVAKEFAKAAVAKYKAEQSQGYGSMVLMLTIAAAMLQIAYILFKFWMDTRTRVPTEAADPAEPFIP